MRTQYRRHGHICCYIRASYRCGLAFRFPLDRQTSLRLHCIPKRCLKQKVKIANNYFVIHEIKRSFPNISCALDIRTLIIFLLPARTAMWLSSVVWTESEFDWDSPNHLRITSWIITLHHVDIIIMTSHRNCVCTQYCFMNNCLIYFCNIENKNSYI